MNILKQKLLKSINLLRSIKRNQLQRNVPLRKIFDHFRKHFNPANLVDSVTPKKLRGKLPDFVSELQNISNNFPINHEVPTIDKILKNLFQLKSGKASNNDDLELLKKM